MRKKICNVRRFDCRDKNWVSERVALVAEVAKSRPQTSRRLTSSRSHRRELLVSCAVCAKKYILFA